jgi:hypothetical protein
MVMKMMGMVMKMLGMIMLICDENDLDGGE